MPRYLKTYTLLMILIVVITLWSIIGTLAFLSNSAITTGTIVDYEVNYKTYKTQRSISSYSPIIEYQPASGPVTRFRSTKSQGSVPVLQSKVSVIYNLADHQDAGINNFESTWLTPLIFSLITFVSGMVYAIFLADYLRGQSSGNKIARY